MSRFEQYRDVSHRPLSRAAGGREALNRAEPDRRPMHGQGSFVFIFRVRRQAREARRIRRALRT